MIFVGEIERVKDMKNLEIFSASKTVLRLHHFPFPDQMWRKGHPLNSMVLVP